MFQLKHFERGRGNLHTYLRAQIWNLNTCLGPKFDMRNSAKSGAVYTFLAEPLLQGGQFTGYCFAITPPSPSPIIPHSPSRLSLLRAPNSPPLPYQSNTLPLDHTDVCYTWISISWHPTKVIAVQHHDENDI